MKRTFNMVGVMLVILIVLGVTNYSKSKKSKLSGLLLENVEVLTKEENDDGYGCIHLKTCFDQFGSTGECSASSWKESGGPYNSSHSHGCEGCCSY